MSDSVMVFDQNMNPLWCGPSAKVEGWIIYQLLNDPRRIHDCRIRIGWPQQYLTASEYLHSTTADVKKG